MKNLFTIILVFILFVAINSVANVPQSYQVELIVFSWLNRDAIDSEQWPRITPEQRLSEYASLDTIDSDFTLSAKDKLSLNNEQKRMIKNLNYKILLHTAWIIPAQKLANTMTLHLYGGQAFDASGAPIAMVTDESLPYTQANTWQLNGTMTISLQRYFNLGFNLIFAEPSSLINSISNSGYFSNNSDPYVYFKLHQIRRMRSNELNYIGHPLFGVLVKIMPSKDIPKNAQPPTIRNSAQSS